MLRNVNLKGLFTPQAVAETIKALPPLKTTIMDSAFKSTANHPFPTIGITELKRVTGTVAFVKRDGTSVKLDAGTAESTIFAPLPVRPSIDITAAELNDLSLIFADMGARSAWVSSKIDELRGIVRETTEALSSIVLTTGKLSWPIQLSGGATGTFTIDYGAPLSYAPAKPFNDSNAKLSDVYATLTDMDNAIQEAGFGGNVSFMTGRAAFGHLINLAKDWSQAGGASPYNVKLEEHSIEVAGYKITRVTERYKSPLDGSHINKIEDNSLVAYVPEAGKVYYCAIDSLSADNKALPFHVFTEEKNDSAVVLTGNAKPVPARNPKTVCIATVVA